MIEKLQDFTLALKENSECNNSVHVELLKIASQLNSIGEAMQASLNKIESANDQINSALNDFLGSD
jgi:hypothetical protein